MPPETKTPAVAETEVNSVALKLFAERSARLAGNGAEQVAVQCFKDAESFIAVRDVYKSGAFAEKPEFSVLADCYCPNQKKTHPHNMISREFGNINRVRSILKDLDAHKDGKTYSGDNFEWDEPTTNLARSIFPGIVKAAEAAASN